GIREAAPWSIVILTPGCSYRPTGRNSCRRAALSPSRSIRSRRTAVCPVSNVPVIVVRHVLAPQRDRRPPAGGLADHNHVVRHDQLLTGQVVNDPLVYQRHRESGVAEVWIVAAPYFCI